MKRKRVWIGWSLLIAMEVLTMVGCGMIHRSQGGRREEAVSAEPGASVAGKASIAGSAGEALVLRILTADVRDPELPDRAADLDGERTQDAILASGNEIEFRDNINLGPQALFLVWAGNSLGSAVHLAHVEHRIYNEVNGLVGESKRWPALYDAVTQRWYLPLSKFFEGDGSAEHAGRQHTLLLDLVLENGLRHLVFVRFRAVGPVPKLKVSDSLLPETPQWFNGAQGLQFPGLPGLKLLSARLTNPTGRELSLWVRLPASEPLRTSASLSHRYYLPEYLNLTPPNEKLERRYSGAVLTENLLQVARSDADGPALALPTLSKLAMNAWEAIPLGPHQAVELTWFASSKTSRCTLPAPISKKFEWFVFTEQQCGQLICGETRSQALTELWQVESIALIGKWAAEVRVSLPWESAEAGIPVKSWGWQAKAPADPKADARQLPPYDCQGVF